MNLGLLFLQFGCHRLVLPANLMSIPGRLTSSQAFRQTAWSTAETVHCCFLLLAGRIPSNILRQSGQPGPVRSYAATYLTQFVKIWDWECESGRGPRREWCSSLQKEGQGLEFLSVEIARYAAALSVHTHHLPPSSTFWTNMAQMPMAMRHHVSLPCSATTWESWSYLHSLPTSWPWGMWIFMGPHTHLPMSRTHY